MAKQSPVKDLMQQPAETVAEVKKVARRKFFRSKRRVVRNALVISNVALFIAVSLFIISDRTADTSNTFTNTVVTEDEEVSDPLDTISSADIAVNIAQLARLDQTTAVANNADSINTRNAIVPADSQVVAKPQIVETGVKSIEDLSTYVAVQGDTIPAVAERFGVSSNTIRWANDLTGDAVAAGTTLQIPPVDGVLYTVEDGDTADSLADTYQSDAARIIAFNDAEISGLVAGDEILIPGGEVPITVFRAASPSVSSFRFGAAAIYGYNGYDYGYCTWYASNRRTDIGKPIPANLGNASTWKARAQLAGIPVGNTPQVHAVIWTPPRDYYGHVGFVEEVYPDGSVRISEMNGRGWGVASEKVLTPAQAAGYSYIY